MYPVIVIGLTIVLPLASIIAESLLGSSITPEIIAKWFVFWAVGVRLFAAGLRQVLRPSFTAKAIFKIGDPTAEKLVIEIGFGNLSMGSIAALSLAFPSWVVPAGLTGVVYLGLAGLKHIANKDRNSTETMAMITDLLVAMIVAGAILMRL
ncbi:DUF6790 family protein [Microvirga sp. 2YAF29]|uniref:DUF6790 family protein n=1 Tax=Microvirga sp. 2YAF29 TaxID=3233031 RepID=UPI003F9B9E3A